MKTLSVVTPTMVNNRVFAYLSPRRGDFCLSYNSEDGEWVTSHAGTSDEDYRRAVNAVCECFERKK